MVQGSASLDMTVQGLYKLLHGQGLYMLINACTNDVQDFNCSMNVYNLSNGVGVEAFYVCISVVQVHKILCKGLKR